MLGKQQADPFHSKQCKSTQLFYLPFIYTKVYVLLCTTFEFVFCHKSKHSKIQEKKQDIKSECGLNLNTVNVSPYTSAVLGLIKDVEGTPGILASLRYDWVDCAWGNSCEVYFSVEQGNGKVIVSFSVGFNCEMLGNPGIRVKCGHDGAIATMYFISSSECLWFAWNFAMKRIFSFWSFWNRVLLCVVLVCIFIHSALSILADGKPGTHETHGADVYKLTMFGGLFTTWAEGKPHTLASFGQDVTNVTMLFVL